MSNNSIKPRMKNLKVPKDNSNMSTEKEGTPKKHGTVLIKLENLTKNSEDSHKNRKNPQTTTYNADNLYDDNGVGKLDSPKNNQK